MNTHANLRSSLEHDNSRGFHTRSILCGELKDEPGLHIAMLPQEGAVIEYKLQNTMLIEVTNARQLPIAILPEGYLGMPWSHVSCCNWQFGIQYYGTDGWEPKPAQPIAPIQS